MPRATEELLARLLAAVEHELPRAVDLRHRLHSLPELAHAEEMTAATIAAEMPAACAEAAGTERLCLWAQAIRVLWPCARSSTACRSSERTGASFSATGTTMHACGHDVHMAALVALARAAHELGEALPAPCSPSFSPARRPTRRAPKNCSTVIWHIRT